MSKTSIKVTNYDGTKGYVGGEMWMVESLGGVKYILDDRFYLDGGGRIFKVTNDDGNRDEVRAVEVRSTGLKAKLAQLHEDHILLEQRRQSRRG